MDLLRQHADLVRPVFKIVNWFLNARNRHKLGKYTKPLLTIPRGTLATMRKTIKRN